MTGVNCNEDSPKRERFGTQVVAVRRQRSVVAVWVSAGLVAFLFRGIEESEKRETESSQGIRTGFYQQASCGSFGAIASFSGNQSYDGEAART